MARTYLTLCVITVIASTYVCALHIQPTKHVSVPSELLDSIDIHSLQGIQELDVLNQDRMKQGPSKKIPDLENAEHSPKVAKSCESSTYCEDVVNYPHDAVNKLISKLEKVEILGLKLIDSLDQPTIEQRSNGDDIELCEATEKWSYPKSGVDMNGNKHFLLNGNTTDNYIQGFKVHVCKKTDCKCVKVREFQNGYRGRCKQFYFSWPVKAFTTNGNYEIKTIYSTNIKLPSHCACIAEPCTNIPSESGPNMLMCDSQSSEQ